ncbi:MAG: SlyX family protein [Magnetospirillum sp. WYHS-4]
MTGQRLDDLERHAAQQERTLQQLSDTIAEQWTVIDRLKRDVEFLKDRLRSVEATVDELAPPDVPPPHY